MPIGRFLCGIAALIWDPATGEYLLLRRAESKDFGARAWECPTGRVDQGESFTDALHREVSEEIGARVQIEFIIGVTHFYRGPEQPENELLGVIFGCSLAGSRPTGFGEEHSEMRWVTPEAAYALLPESHWLQDVIQRAENLRRLLPQELRDEFRQKGLEI
jgi:8-oxo-dGTP pyrophosphatase MutT (NUDIX family)